MKKINNPFLEIPGYNCFGCSPDNEHGLQMQFYSKDNKVYSEWDPKEHFQGYGNVLHGGIQTTLIDEIASWVIFIECRTAGVTRELQMKFHAPVFVSKGKLLLCAEIMDHNKNLVDVKVSLAYLDKPDEILSHGHVQYFTYPEKLAKRKLKFPEYEDFFKEPALSK